MTPGAFVLIAAVFARPLERVTTMDPALAQSVYDSRSVKLVYETPLEIDSSAGAYCLAPGYCELPEASADGLFYTFRVRTDDGVPRHAADVVRAFDRLRDPACPNGWIVRSVRDVAVLDDGRFTVELTERVHYFPWLMAMAPMGVRDASGGGTGPFELTKWRRNHEMVFTRRVPVAGGFSEVRYLVIDDPSTQWLMFLRGEVDFLGEISRDNWSAVMRPDGTLDPSLSRRGVRLYSVPSLEVPYIGFNMNDPVVGPNRALRQALNAAFDYPRWEEYYQSTVLPADGPLPPGIDGRLETPFAYSFNLEKARRLLVEAGYPDGIDPATGRHLVLTLSMGRASQDARESGELMASFFERIGIRLELRFQTWNAFVSSVNAGQVQLYRIGWVGDYPDAQNFLQLFYSPNAPHVNHSSYSNPAFDRAYELACAATDEAERNALWRRCQEIVREDCPWIFTHFTKTYSLVRSRVGNCVPSAFPYGQERFFTVNENEDSLH